MAEKRKRPTSGYFFRIFLFGSCIAILAYGNYDNREMRKVRAEFVAIAVAGAVMGLQVYWTFAYVTQLIKPKYHVPRLPYHYLTMVVTDVLTAAAWCAVLGLLAYWDREVVYKPKDGDPKEWFDCHGATGSETVLSYGGLSDELILVWCPVIVDGKHRLIGNGSARVQLHALIGLAAGSLFFTGFVLTWVLLMGKVHELFPWRRQKAEGNDMERASS